MDRAEAINIMKDLHNRWATWRGVSGADTPEVMRAINMAIAALREQEQREQGCEFCNERDIAVMSASLMTFDLVHKGCVCWYCPNCGRKLTESPKEGAEG